MYKGPLYTTQEQVRSAFWQAAKRGDYGSLNVTTKRIPNYSGNGKMHNTDTCCSFADFVDHLAKSGQISSALADRVTLD